MTEPCIATTEPASVAFITMRGPYSQTPEGLGRLYAWIGHHALQPVGMPAAVYLTAPADTPEADARWELWAPVAGDVAEREPDAAGVGVKHIESATVASVMYKGPYENIPPTYEMLGRWIAENGYVPAGPPMERYYSDPADVPPEEYLTEVLMPVRPA